MFANYLFILSDKLVRMACGIAANALLFSYLAPSELGTWNYVLSLVTIAGAISIFSGLDVIVIRDFVQTEKINHGKIIGSVVLLRLCTGTIAALGCLGFSIWTGEQRLTLLTSIIAISYFTQPFNSIDYYFQSRLTPRYSAVVLNTATIAGFSLKLFLIHTKQLDIELLCWILVLESALTSLGYIWFAINNFAEIKPAKWKIDRLRIKTYSKKGLALLASGLVSVFIARISIFQIDASFDRASVAVFGLFTLIIESILMVNYTLANTFFPRIIKHRPNPNAYSLELRKLAKHQAVLWLSVSGSAAAIIFLYRDSIEKLLNPIYKQSIDMILFGLPTTGLFIINFYLLQFVIIPSGNERHQLERALIGLLTLTLSNFFLFSSGTVISVVGSIALAQIGMLGFTATFHHKTISRVWYGVPEK